MNKYLKINVPPTFQAFGNKVVQIYDVSAKIIEAPAINNPGLLTIHADEIFHPGTVFLGMGIPNVYLAHVYGPKSVKVLAAKSLYREETKVVESYGKVQSGLLFVATNISEEEIEVVKKSAHSREGNTTVTCLNESMNILSNAGFGVGGINITDYKLPHLFLMDLLQGMRPTINGRSLQFSVVKSTRQSLTEYYNSIVSATLSTPLRHLFRSMDTEHAKEERKKIAQQISLQNQEKMSEILSEEKEGSGGMGPTFAVLVSETSSLGAFFRSVWGTHVICKIQVGEIPAYGELLRELLPTTLKEFDRKMDFVTSIKKNVLFCESVVNMVRSHMAHGFDRHVGFTQKNLVNLLQQEKLDGNERKYNFVVTGKEVIIISNSICFGFVDWILSKHVLISGYSPDVRFAGEIWSEDGVLHINRNSGTYCPTLEQLDNVVKMASIMFPDLKFVPEFTEIQQPREEGGDEEYKKGNKEEEGGDEEYKKGNKEEEDLWDEMGWVAFPPEGQKKSFEDEIDEVRRNLSVYHITPLKTTTLNHPHHHVTIGVLMAKFDPLTTHHEKTIESALQAGVFDKLVLVPSDITSEVFRTPVLDRQNMANQRYQDDPRIITFLAHTLPNTFQPWVQSIVKILRKTGFSPVSVFLWEDFSDPNKKSQLVNLVNGDQYLVLYGDKEEGVENIPNKDIDTGKEIIKHIFQKPPSTEGVRQYLSHHPELFENQKIFSVSEDELPLSMPVRAYIYKNKLYYNTLISGNLVDSFRNMFGTGLGDLLGRTPVKDEEVNKKVTKKLENIGIVL